MNLAPCAGLADPSDLCLTAARAAAAETGVPISVLIAVTQTETGRNRDGQTRPWPWTVNVEGAGHWFDDASAAIAFARNAYAGGARSFDVGCFQLNYRWHADNFESIEQMFDPIANARYAAGFLTDLYAETGDWSQAAGAYHSRTPVYADRYRLRFDAYRDAAVASGADGGTLMAAAAPVTMRANTFPLLQATGGQRSLGSLVPLGGS